MLHSNYCTIWFLGPKAEEMSNILAVAHKKTLRIQNSPVPSQLNRILLELLLFLYLLVKPCMGLYYFYLGKLTEQGKITTKLKLSSLAKPPGILLVPMLLYH